MSVHHVVRHSRPASVRLTFVSFINHYYFETRGPLNPGGIVALHWFGGYVSTFFPHGVFLVFRIRQCYRESFPSSQLVVVIVPHVCCSCLLLGSLRFFCLLAFPTFLPSAIFCTKVRAGTTRLISKKLRDGLDIQSFKAGVNVKAVFTSLNTAFLPISRSRFKRRQIPMLITLSTIWQFCVNFWVIFRCFGKERFFLKG